MFSSWSQVKQIEFCKENELIWTSIPLFTATDIFKKSNDESTFLNFESMIIFLPLLRVKYIETSLSVLMLWKRSRALSIVKVKFSKSKILSFSRKMFCWSFIRTSPDSNLVVLLAYWFWFHNAREFGRLVSHTIIYSQLKWLAHTQILFLYPRVGRLLSIFIIHLCLSSGSVGKLFLGS